MKNFKIKSTNNFVLQGSVFEPNDKAKGVVIIAHGMSEHKERYYDFMKYLSDNGYITVIYDHRGHGKSIDNNGLGYFGNDKDILIKDLHQVILYIKKKYPNLKTTLFGHSMGSLVARRYIALYDDTIDKLILCGTPTYNKLSKVAILLANAVSIFKGNKHRSKLLNNLSVGSYNKGFKEENSWLSVNNKNVIDYNNDELCGFIFTVNGFKMLFYLLDIVYNKKEYKFNNKILPILIIGGRQDPVIGGKDKFIHLFNFLKEIGYSNINNKLYDNMRHEILNEEDNKKVYKDILTFVNK